MTTRSETAAIPRLLTEAEAAGLLHWSPRTLQRHRWARQPPSYVKIGRNVRYDAADLADFIAAGRREGATP